MFWTMWIILRLPLFHGEIVHGVPFLTASLLRRKKNMIQLQGTMDPHEPPAVLGSHEDPCLLLRPV